jgi:hypothetical protein
MPHKVKLIVLYLIIDQSFCVVENALSNVGLYQPGKQPKLCHEPQYDQETSSWHVYGRVVQVSLHAFLPTSFLDVLRPHCKAYQTNLAGNKKTDRQN